MLLPALSPNSKQILNLVPFSLPSGSALPMSYPQLPQNPTQLYFVRDAFPVHKNFSFTRSLTISIW